MAEPPRVVADDPEIDPELVRLKRRIPVGPVLAVSVLGLALLLMWQLRADLAYAGHGDAPVDLGRADAPAALVENSFVTLTGHPDAVAPLRVRGAQETGHRLAPFLGSGARVWLEDGDASTAPPPIDDRYSGRLLRVTGTELGAELARYTASAPPAPHVVTPDALRPPLALDANHDPLAPASGDRVVLALVVADQSRVLFVRTDDIPDEPAARAALSRLAYPAAAPVEQTDRSWSYDVAAAPAAVNAALHQARLFGAAASARVEHVEGTVGALDLSAADQVTLGGRALPRAAIDHALVWTRPALPGDVWVLVSGDFPSSLWYMRPLYLMLAVVALLMLWALVVDARQLRRPPARATKPHLVT
jgi:hypothetical protein